MGKQRADPTCQVGEAVWDAACTPGERLAVVARALEKPRRPSPKTCRARVAALANGVCARLTQPGNPSLPSSCPSDSRLLQNHGEPSRRSELAPRRFGKETRCSTGSQYFPSNPHPRNDGVGAGEGKEKGARVPRSMPPS